ncbi:4a-hydroxytetrahydrobiopterin dehydratase [Patescibacteria group bacterium]|nr:4a-hydroxytetrahydrobiopterin dehydratase [Patescibacteria group bacterium]
MDLSQKKCVVCRANTPILSDVMIAERLGQLRGWTLYRRAIQKTFRFNNFKEALAFFNKVAEISEKEDHHPDMGIYRWRNVDISFTSHAAFGLTENDFIMAAKVDKL